MRKNTVKRVLRDGGVALGTSVFEFATTGMARIVAATGAEFIFFDMEHTGWSIETIRMLLATTAAVDLVSIVRPPALEYHLLSRPLDLGAMGLMVPIVETEDQARLIVQYAKYPPQGKRGAAFGVAHDDYQGGDVSAKMKSANEEGLLIALIETGRGIEHVEEISAVDGIDVLWIGHFDLTNSLGIPAQFTHPDYLRAVDHVLEACKRHGKAAGLMVGSVEDGQAALARGFRCLSYWGDSFIYREAVNRSITSLRSGLPGQLTVRP
jgi:2-keto-3-deoxy-L-rhamnonate aldolase RhmA